MIHVQKRNIKIMIWSYRDFITCSVPSITNGKRLFSIRIFSIRVLIHLLHRFAKRLIAFANRTTESRASVSYGGDESLDACSTLAKVSHLSDGADGFLAVKDSPNIKENELIGSSMIKASGFVKNRRTAIGSQLFRTRAEEKTVA